MQAVMYTQVVTVRMPTPILTGWLQTTPESWITKMHGNLQVAGGVEASLGSCYLHHAELGPAPLGRAALGLYSRTLEVRTGLAFRPQLLFHKDGATV